MKILVIHNAYVHRGGEDVCVEREISVLREYGLDVESFIVRNTGGLETATNALQAPFGYGVEMKLEKRLKEFRPTLIHVHNLIPALSPRIFACAKKMGVRVVSTLHNYRPLCLNGLFRTPEGELCERCAKGSYQPGVKRGCYRESRTQSLALSAHLYYAQKARWYEKVDAFIAPCRFLRDRFLHYGWTSPDRLHVQGHFLSEFPTTPVQEPEPYILYLGRFSEEKGLRWLLNTFKTFVSPGLRLVIGGDGPLRPFVNEAATKSHIEYVGYVNDGDKDRLLSKASALVLPSLCYENFPLAALEANAWGVPLIVSRLGGLAELVETGLNGISFEAGNTSEFSSALSFLKNLRSVAARNACRNFVRERFSKEQFLRSRLELYAKTCA